MLSGEEQQRVVIERALASNSEIILADEPAGNLSRLNAETPEDLGAHKSREWVIMDLDKACDFFGVNFKRKQFFGR